MSDNNIEHGKPGTYTNEKCRCDLCKEAWREYFAPRRISWYHKNKKSESERMGSYYERNKQKIIERSAKWRADNHEKAKAISLAYYYAHKEEINRKAREKYARDRANNSR